MAILFAVLVLSLGTYSQGQIGSNPDPLLQALRATYPGVAVYDSNGRVRAVFGTPMTRGQTGSQAARAWIGQYGGVFGEPGVDLRETWSVDLTSGKSVHAYRQYMGGVPLEGSLARVVVAHGNCQAL